MKRNLHDKETRHFTVPQANTVPTLQTYRERRSTTDKILKSDKTMKAYNTFAKTDSCEQISEYSE